jgi:hypothetical protein
VLQLQEVGALCICPEKKRNVGGSIGNKPNQFQEEHINHVNMEEDFEAPNVATRTFLLALLKQL